MKNLFFLPFFLLLVMTSCQKEEVITQTSPKINPILSLQSVQGVLNQIDFEALHTENGILHFETLEQLHQTINLLDVANETYINFIKQQHDVLPASEVNYDESFVAKQFINHFNGFRALIFSDKGVSANDNFFEAIPPSIQSILNKYGEAFVGDNYQRFYQNGEYTELLSPSEMQILNIRNTNLAEYRVDCDLSNYNKGVFYFNPCGIEYELYYRVGYFNVEPWNVHAIYGFSRTRKGDGTPINVNHLETSLEGFMSILCENQINITIATGFNAALNPNGNVPNEEACNNCDSTFPIVTYTKNITQVKEHEDYLTGHFVVEVICNGEVHREERSLTIEN